MFKIFKHKIFPILLLLAVLLAACSPAASNPQIETQGDVAVETAAVTATAIPVGTATTGAASVEQAGTAATEVSLSQNEEVAVPTTFRLDAWADNWFAAYLGEELLVEDSVPITVERSFNAETVVFEASYPLHLNFILKDYIQDNTGLEYIGTPRQQMGDGGFIMQLTDLNTGQVVAVSNQDWACTVIHEAPLDKACENEPNPVAGVPPCEFIELDEPAGWKLPDFDDSEWTATTVYSASAVAPKGGYNDIAWDSSAQFIWGPDLETNNTLLCRVTVLAP